jgi:hypothetical protein
LILSLTPDAPLSLALAELTKTETADWQTRLNREWMACGCRAGEIGAELAIAGYVIAALLGTLPGCGLSWSHVGWAALAALVAAATGKILSRARSLIRFRRLIQELDVVFAKRRSVVFVASTLVASRSE